MVQGWAALQGRGREGCTNKGDREKGAAVGGGRGKSTDGKLGKGKGRKRRKGVLVCLHVFFHGLTQLMLDHTK